MTIHTPQKLVNSLLLISFVLFTQLVSWSAYAEEKNRYVVGIVPQFDAREIHAIWRPILDQLEKRTGAKFEIKGSLNIPEFERELTRGDFDFAYASPTHLLAANKTQGYIPLIRDQKRKLRGILVVSKDSPIQSIQELNNQTVAFPSPGALGASILNRVELKQKGIEIQARYVQTHSSVYLNVALGETAAGGGVQRTFDQQSEEIKNSLKILHRTRKVAPHPVIAHPRVAKSLQTKVKDALLKMGHEADALLGRIPITHVGPASMTDYDELRKMNLDRL